MIPMHRSALFMGLILYPKFMGKLKKLNRELQYLHFQIRRSNAPALHKKSLTLPRTTFARYISEIIIVCWFTKIFHLLYLLKHNVRNNINVIYNTALPVIFGVKKYADCLWNVCNERGICVNLQTNLVKINPNEKQATFEKLNSGETSVQNVCFFIQSKSKICLTILW